MLFSDNTALTVQTKGEKMNSIYDKIILLCICLFTDMAQQEAANIVIPLAIGISCSAFLEFLNNKRTKLIVTGVYIAASLFIPELLYFIPLVIYDVISGYGAFLIAPSAVIAAYYYERFSWLSLAGIALALVVAFFLNIYTTRYAKIKQDYINKRDELTEQSLNLKKRLSQLKEQQDLDITVATLNERNRIAREIHDNVGHLLSSSILQLGAIITVTGDSAQKENLRQLQETLNTGMNSIRSSVHNLRDDSIDLNIQLVKIVNEFTFCKVNLNYSINTPPPVAARYSVINIVKESLSNVMRHSDASEVTVSLFEHPKIYQLIVKDNGTTADGKDINKISQGGIGLDSIRQRGESLGGIVNFSVNKGFRVFVSFPKTDSEANRLP